MSFCHNCLRDIPANECHSHCSQHPFASEASRLRARIAELEEFIVAHVNWSDLVPCDSAEYERIFDRVKNRNA